jgi:hypothetical protein
LNHIFSFGDRSIVWKISQRSKDTTTIHGYNMIRMKILALLLLFFIALLAVGTALAQSKPEEVVFPSGGRQLHGFLWKPEGRGPFRAILWNHGSEKLPGSQPTLANFYISHSYVFFVPHRRGQGRSPGDYIEDQIAKAPPGERARRMIDLQEAEVDDVIAALNYLKSLPFVDHATPFQDAPTVASKPCSRESATLTSRRLCRSLPVQCRGGKTRCFTIS